jgi:hypothetical protein
MTATARDRRRAFVKRPVECHVKARMPDEDIGLGDVPVDVEIRSEVGVALLEP